MNKTYPNANISDGGDKPAASLDERLDDAPLLTKRQRAKRHCLRFWWAYLIGFICFVVLVVCLIVFVAVPKIAQHQLDKAELSVEGIQAVDAQADQFTMAINSTIRTDGKFASSRVAPFTGVMYLADLPGGDQKPFVSIDFPATTGAELQVVNISQLVTPDVPAFTVFNTWLLFNQSLRVTITGDTTVRVKGIARDYGVTFTKTITIPGLAGLPNMTVPTEGSNLAVGSTVDAAGDNFNGTVNIPNLSLVTFDLGNATFNTYLLGQYVGPSYLDNAVLRPGTNTFAMRANISQVNVLAALGQQPYCSHGGQLPFTLIGKDVVNHGQNLTYYGDAMAAGNLSLTLNIGAKLQALGLNIPCAST